MHSVTHTGDVIEHGRDNERMSGSMTAAGWVKVISIVLIVASVLVLVRLLPVDRAAGLLAAQIDGLGLWGPLVFAGVYVVWTVLFLPGSVLTLAAGALFGLWIGTITVSLGSTLGAAAAFVIGRYLARDAVERKLRGYPKFAAVDRAVAQGGWKIVALLRLSPAVPFNLQNYLYGLTAIRFWPCIVASWAAMLPGTFAWVYLGFAGREAVGVAAGAEVERAWWEWGLLGVGLAATIAVTVYVTRLARRAIAEQTEVEGEGVGASDEATKRRSDEGWGARPWRGTIVWAGVAVLMVVLTVVVWLQRDVIGGMFGPPQVAMREAHEPRPDGPVFDHSPFERILRDHVNENGGVDYAGLYADPGALLMYNRSLAEAPFDEMGRDEKLALLINAYNSFTLELILDYWDEGRLESIRDIPAAERWDAERWNVGGHIWSLNQIEHEQIRPKFVEPDIHWAVVCAAVGCPPLRRDAYTAERLAEQLQEQGRIMHTDGSRWFRYDREAGVVHLTPLYQWYAGDFEQVAGSVLDYAGIYAPELRRDLERGERPRVRWLEYDWSLNTQENLR
jgi:uncharacterized membrane protein YdjX (TVP38/TMEM64 family)